MPFLGSFAVNIKRELGQLIKNNKTDARINEIVSKKLEDKDGDQHNKKCKGGEGCRLN